MGAPGGGTCSQAPPTARPQLFLGEGTLGWMVPGPLGSGHPLGLAGDGSSVAWPEGAPTTTPPKCSQGGHSTLLAAWTKMFLVVFNVLYSFGFKNFNFNQGLLKENLKAEPFFFMNSSFVGPLILF